METFADLLAPDRGDATALETPDQDGSRRSVSYDRVRTNAWKTGNFLRQLGVGRGRTVAVVTAPVPEPLFAFLGAALLGAATRFDPPNSVDARALVAPTDSVGEYDLPPGGGRVGYGDPPADPAVAHFERDVWSENPTFPPTDLPPETPAVETAGERYGHGPLLAAATAVAQRHGLGPGDRVALRAPLADPRAVVAGVLAPLSVGATVRLDADAVALDGEADLAVVVDGDEGDAKTRTLAVDDVAL